MPKNYTKEELENGRWVTMKGTRVFIKDGETPQEAIDRAIGKKAEQEPMTWEQKADIVDRFTYDYNVEVDRSVLRDIPDDTFNMVFKTLRQQLDYEGEDGLILTRIELADLSSEKAMATMSSDGDLTLDRNTFSKSKAELDKKMKDSAEQKFHPNGNASSIIMHELGHARFNMMLANLYEKYKNPDDWGAISNTINEWYKIQNDCAGSEFKPRTDTDMYLNEGLYYNFQNKVVEFTEKCQNSEYLKKMWGGKVNLSLYGLVNPEHNYTDAISKYATTNIHEMCAEAYADVMVNGYTKAHYMSQMVYDEFLKEDWKYEEE